jgi:hypothetical protein
MPATDPDTHADCYTHTYAYTDGFTVTICYSHGYVIAYGYPDGNANGKRPKHLD